MKAELETVLFHRTTKGIWPTSAANYLYEKADLIMLLYITIVLINKVYYNKNKKAVTSAHYFNTIFAVCGSGNWRLI